MPGGHHGCQVATIKKRHGRQIPFVGTVGCIANFRSGSVGRDMGPFILTILGACLSHCIALNLDLTDGETLGDQ